MERLLVTEARDLSEMKEWLRTTRDGDLFDFDVLRHNSTFTLKAFGSKGPTAYAPIAQPLMIEHLIMRPGLSLAETGQAIVRLAEHAIEEAYRRDVGDIYFLGHDESTCKFAERYGFKELSKIDPPLRCYRMNLLETYGC